ncbi:MAG: MFS transporter [Streptomycetaceae bacterium]|nr:MFS transporter [Streptomycetaceae bacterium]
MESSATPAAAHAPSLSKDALPSGAPPLNPKRWLALAFIGLAQLMVIIDVTIVNIALPSAAKSFDVSDSAQQWVLTAYTLAFGSLLLMGGRIADYMGRKRTFMIGLTGFAVASALGGAAQSFGLLLAARALQGGFGALLAPSALSLLAVLFTDPKERAKAFGVFGAIAGGGSALGLVLGGALTEYLNWRWCFYVNVPIALIAGIGLYLVVAEVRSADRARFDLPGLALATSGLFAIVYALSKAESKGWDSPLIVGLLVGGSVLLTAFVYVESRVDQPLLPLRVVLNRTRGGAYTAIALGVIGMFGLFLFLTFYLQTVKGYSPVRAGCAFLPMSVGVVISGGGITPRLITKVAPRMLIAPGLLLASAAMFMVSRMEVDTSFWTWIMPAELLLGVGMGMVMSSAMNYATHGVGPQDAGIASAMANTSQQVGGSIGVALLSTISTSARTDYLESHPPQGPRGIHEGMVHGFTTATTYAGFIMLGAAALVALLMNTPRPRQPGEGTAPRSTGSDAVAAAPSPALHVG